MGRPPVNANSGLPPDVIRLHCGAGLKLQLASPPPLHILETAAAPLLAMGQIPVPGGWS